MSNFEVVFLPYLKLCASALIPIALSIIVYLLKEKTKLGKLPYWPSQIIIGIIFSGAAIFATECGVKIDTSVINIRDAAPMCAGILFGGPAGIIAGFIGGVERYVAVLWGIGSYTQLACSIATFLAGVYGAILRRYFFADDKPTVGLSFFAGIVMEVIHMFMVFLTHPNDSATALQIIKVCLIPMAIGNAASLALSVLIVTVLAKETKKVKESRKSLARRFQFWLLVAVCITLVIGTSFIFVVQTEINRIQAEKTISSSVKDVSNNLISSCDTYIREKTKSIKLDIDDHLELDADKELNEKERVKYYNSILKSACEKQPYAKEISMIKDNITIASTEEGYIGNDISKNPMNKEFRFVSKEQAYIQSYRNKDQNTSSLTTADKYSAIQLSNNNILIIGFEENEIQQHIVENSATELTEYHHIGETGQIFITNENGTICASTNKLKGYNLSNLGIKISQEDVNKSNMVSITIFNEKYYCVATQCESYCIFGILSHKEVFSSRENSIYLNSLLQIMLFAILYSVVYLLVNTLIIKNIKIINNKLQNISDGKLNTVIDKFDTRELNGLSQKINETVDTLKEYIKEANERIDKEIQLAKDIQTSTLPSIFPAFPNVEDFDIYATMQTAKDVGGDFYDFYMLGEKRVCFLIADVSGKGVPAAMFMMQSKALITNYIQMGGNLGDAITLVNKELCKRNQAGMFVTAFICILDLDSGDIDFVNAGHNPPLIYRKDKGYEYLISKPGFVLAGLEDYKYKTQTLTLNPGDKIYLYTDGVTEAINGNNVAYGEKRLKKVLNKNIESTVYETLNAVKNDMEVFVEGAEQFDDITMLTLAYTKKINDNIISTEREFPARTDELDNVLAFIEEELSKVNAPLKYIPTLNIVVEEIFVNIAHYAYKGKGIDGKAWITFTYDKETNDLTLEFVDEGISFNPLAKEDPDITLSAEQRDIGGLGIFMVKKMMDTVKYDHFNGDNILTITKKLK